MLERVPRFTFYLWKATNGRIAISTLLLLAAGLTEGLSLILLVPIISLAAPGSAEGIGDLPIVGDWLAATSPSLELMLLMLVLMVCLQAAFLRIKTVYTARIFQLAIDRTRMAMFRKLGMVRWEAYSAHRPSDLNYLLTGETDRILAAANSFQVLLQAIALLLIYSVLALLVSWQMTVFTLITGAVLFTAVYPVRRRAAKFGHDLTELHEQRGRTILEFLTGMRIAKSFAVEDVYAGLLGRHLKGLRSATVGFAKVSSTGTLVFQVGGAIVGVGFVWLAVEMLRLDIARIAFLVVVFVRLLPRFLVLQDYIQQFLTNLPAFERFNSAITRFAAAEEPMPRQGAPVPVLRDQLTLGGIGKRFDGASAPGLEDVDLTIRAKCITALIGPSGSGKSTLADLLQGLTVPTDGSIRIDGTLLDDGNRRLWRQAVAFVPQDPFLFNDTIAANLLIASPQASDAQMWEALKKVNLAALVRCLPEGLATQAGDRGSRFSGGERQRMALARALMREPQLLILDEATSALDGENQTMITDTIERLRGTTTIVTIAHRPSMIRIADEVVALHEGRVVETGSFEALIGDRHSRLSMVMRSEARVA